MGSQVVQLNLNMKGNEGSKIPRMVPKRFISESNVFVETYMHLLSKIESDKKRQFIFKCNETTCSTYRLQINYNKQWSKKEN